MTILTREAQALIDQRAEHAHLRPYLDSAHYDETVVNSIAFTPCRSG